MRSVLIAMPKHGDALSIVEILAARGLNGECKVCGNAAEVLRTAAERDFGVVICTKNLKDMNYAELLNCLPRSFYMVLLTSDTSLELYSERAVKLTMPFRKGELTELVLRLLEQSAKVFRKEDGPRRRRSAAEQRIIDDTKRLIMDRFGMTEPFAYRYIQKYSMDNGLEMTEAARILTADIDKSPKG